MMYAPYILRRPPFVLREMQFQICGETWTASREYEESVQSQWKKMKAGEALWDGTYYRVIDPAEIADGETVRLGVISYRYIATFRSLDEQHARDGLKRLHHFSTAALVRTSDSFYVFGRRSQNGAVDLLGGGVQPDELAVHSGAELEENLYKEILEEAGIERSDVAGLTGLGGVVSETSNVIVLALLSLSTTRSHLESQFSRRTEQEMEELVFVPEKELRWRLEEMRDYRSLIPQLLSRLSS